MRHIFLEKFRFVRIPFVIDEVQLQSLVQIVVGHFLIICDLVSHFVSHRGVFVVQWLKRWTAESL